MITMEMTKGMKMKIDEDTTYIVKQEEMRWCMSEWTVCDFQRKSTTV